MRLLCELFLAAVLIWLGWDKSFHALTNQWRGISEPAPATATSQMQSTTTVGSETTNVPPQAAPARRPYVGFPARAAAAPTPSGEWMWDPAHRGTLDAPATKAGAAANPTAPPSETYWIDGNGVRHYSNAPPPSHSP